MADEDRETLELICDALLCWARCGWGNWRLLIVDVSTLPDDLVRRFWSELYKTRDSGHAREMFAAIKEYGVPPEPPLPAQPEPVLDETELTAAQYLAGNPRPSYGEMTTLFKISKETARYWRASVWADGQVKRNKGIERYVALRWAEQGRKASIAQMAQRLAEPLGVERHPEFLCVATYDAQHPGATAEEAESATGVPASLIRRWRRMPQFGAAMTMTAAQ